MFKDRGIVKELTMQDISDRDVSQLERSFQALKKMVKLFPDSEYADDAANRMTYLMNKISERELHVARYYMKRDAFPPIWRLPVGLGAKRVITSFTKNSYITSEADLLFCRFAPLFEPLSDDLPEADCWIILSKGKYIRLFDSF